MHLSQAVGVNQQREQTQSTLAMHCSCQCFMQMCTHLSQVVCIHQQGKVRNERRHTAKHALMEANPRSCVAQVRVL